MTARRLIEPYPNKMLCGAEPACEASVHQRNGLCVFSAVYAHLHPSYAEDGGVPAIEEVRFSLVSNRGCFGGCSFCALTFHQGRVIQTRSHESILQEASRMVWELISRVISTMWAADGQLPPSLL